MTRRERALLAGWYHHMVIRVRSDGTVEGKPRDGKSHPWGVLLGPEFAKRAVDALVNNPNLRR